MSCDAAIWFLCTHNLQGICVKAFDFMCKCVIAVNVNGFVFVHKTMRASVV
jgi:hypothetical protein